MDRSILEAKEARARAATPGPWKLDEFGMYFFAPDGSPVLDRVEDRDLLLRLRGRGAEVSGHRPAGSQDANARLVESAREDILELVAEVRRLQAILIGEINER